MSVILQSCMIIKCPQSLEPYSKVYEKAHNQIIYKIARMRDEGRRIGASLSS